MLDIKLIRENPELVKENIRKKFQDGKLALVDKVLELDRRNRAIKTEVEQLRAKRNAASKRIGALMGQGKRDEAEAVKKEVALDGDRITELTAEQGKVDEEILNAMMVIPNIIGLLALSGMVKKVHDDYFNNFLKGKPSEFSTKND